MTDGTARMPRDGEACPCGKPRDPQKVVAPDDACSCGNVRALPVYDVGGRVMGHALPWHVHHMLATGTIHRDFFVSVDEDVFAEAIAWIEANRYRHVSVAFA